jgi:hypothetical protein
LAGAIPAGLYRAELSDSGPYQTGASLEVGLSKLNAAAPEVQQAVSAAITALPQAQQAALSAFCGALVNSLTEGVKAASAADKAGVINIYAGLDKALTELSDVSGGDATLEAQLKQITTTGRNIIDLLQKGTAGAELDKELATLNALADEGGLAGTAAASLASQLGFLRATGNAGEDINKCLNSLTSVLPLSLLIRLNQGVTQSARLTQGALHSIIAIMSEMVLKELDIRAERAEEDVKSHEVDRRKENEQIIRRDTAQNITQSALNAQSAAAVDWLRAQASGAAEAYTLLNALILEHQAASHPRSAV